MFEQESNQSFRVFGGQSSGAHASSNAHDPAKVVAENASLPEFQNSTSMAISQDLRTAAWPARSPFPA